MNGGGGLVIAVDCSTTAAKAVIHDAAGHVVAQAARPLRTLQPCPAWHEQDAEQWWLATQGAIAEAVAALDAPGRVRALCITHQRESFVCLDGSGRPLRPAILWLDGRAHEEIAELGSTRVHELSGKPPDTTPALYKLAWLARHEASVLRDAVHVGDVQAYLAWRLTGRWATSHGSADTLGLFDLRRQDWSAELLELAGVRVDQLPDLVPAGEFVGTVQGEVARSLGLPGPVHLVAGIGDGQAAGLALGATAPGVAYLNLGTSMVLGVQSREYRWDPAFRTLAGLRPGTYTLETVLNAAAYVATWCREQFGERGADGTAGRDMETAAARLPIGAEGLLTLPYWNAAQTPHWDALARGAVVGWHGRHTAAHLYRSILEGVGFELRLHLERLEEATGQRIESIRAVGGGARSSLWTRIVSDITQRPVRVCADREVSAAGAAALAWRFLDRARLASEDVAPPALPAGHDVSPDPSTANGYDALFAVYRRLYPSLRGLFPDLAAAAGGIPIGYPVSADNSPATPLASEGARLGRRAQLLAGASVSYNVLEAVVAIAAGAAAGSVALVGFGLDSVVEVSSGLVILWQFRHRLPETRERQALRLMAVSFFALAAYVSVESLRALLTGAQPDTSPVGIGLAVASLAVMPLLSWAQRRTGRALGSGSVVADSKQTLLCTYLSAVLLAGLVLNATLGWSWADPVAGLVIAGVAVNEGIRAWRGDACCSPAAPLLAENDGRDCGCADAEGQ